MNAPSTEITTNTAAQRSLRTDQAMLCCLVLVTTLALFGLKIYIACRDLSHDIPPPRIWDGALVPSLGRVLSCTAEDFAVGLGCLLVALILVRLKRAMWYRRTLLISAHLAAAFAICYMVINAQVFHILRKFLTYSLFLLGGGFKPEKSVDGSANLQMRLLVALIPLLALAVHLVLFRYLRPYWQRMAFVLRPLVVLGLVLVFGAVAQGARKGVFSEPPQDFAKNPHLHLARSYFAHVTFGQIDDADDIDSTDFEPGNADTGLHEVLDTGRPRNVVLIVLESTSTLYLQNYGYEPATTPQLCALKDRGIIFDNCYSNSTHTLASSLTLQASLYNDTNEWNTARSYRRVQFPCAAAWLKEYGYRTYFVGAGGKGVWCHPDESSRYFRAFDLARTGNRYWSEETRPWPLSDDDYTDSDMFADAEKCIDDAGKRPFFLMTWNYATHFFYEDEPNDEEFDEDQFPRGVFRDADTLEDYVNYLRALHNADRRIGKLYHYLEKRGLADDTLFIVTGDHGEAWGQHGKYTHGHGLFEEDIHVPLVFLCPKLAHLGPHRDVVGSHVDIWPTIADVLGLPPHPQWQGRSLFAPLPDEPRRTYFSRVGGMGIREGRYKYIWDYDDSIEMLFDLQEDPGELHNLAPSEPDYCLTQRRRLRDWTLYQPKYLKTLER